MLKRIYFLAMVMLLLLSFGMVLRAENVPLITAKDGILYKDGIPCFLPGVFGERPFDTGLRVNEYYCKGSVSLVPGKEGKGLKISFRKTDKPTGRWVDFIPPVPNPREWVEKKYKFLKLWVKGDGSDNVVKLKVQNWVPPKEVFSAYIGEFSLADTDWKQIIIPLEDKYNVLAKMNYCDLVLDGQTDKEFYFILDNITVEGDEGEIVLYDFEKETAGRRWSRWNERDKFKDDPVYKAIWDDPLYREVSGENFQAIGVSTYHLSDVAKEHVADLLPASGSTTIAEETYLCEQLKGLPMVPGFTFDWIYYGGERGEEQAKELGIPPTALMRTPDGRILGGYGGMSFEDPLGKKVWKELWQRGPRHLLKNGANIYAYELINENGGFYSEAHQNNRELFIQKLKEKHGDISGLNKVWGTDYKSFDEVMKRISELGGLVSKKIKGLTVEWQKFMEDRYVEMLYQGGQWIHEVEDSLGKPHSLIGVMGGTPIEFNGYGGTDLYKQAQKLDVIETEDGIRFGTTYDIEEVTPLTYVLASKDQYFHLMCMDLVDAVSGNKPIINTEHNVIRSKENYQQPVTKADIITSLWEEFLRGVSATHTYRWSVAYLNEEEALAKGRENRELLSPYLYPRESLNGYKEVQEEIGRVADVLMDRPRLGRDAEIAVLFSRPTARYLIEFKGWVAPEPNTLCRSHLNFYSYLLENHYPLRYLYEEQLPEKKADKYKVILVPHSDYIYPGTLEYLTDYVRKGGRLVCFGDAFRYDEYGNKKDNSSLLGLEQENVDAFAETLKLGSFGKVKIISKRKLIPRSAKMLVDFLETKSPFITVNKIGKGEVYYVNADSFRLEGQDSQIGPIMDYIMDKLNLKAPIEVISIEDKKEPVIEAHLIDRGDKKVIFIVNWLPYNDRVVKVKIKDINDQDKYYLIDIAKNSAYTKGGEDIFTGGMLKQGINLYLPEEERVVLLLTKERYQLSKKSMELLSDKEAMELDAELKEQVETTSQQAGISRKIILVVPGNITTGQIKQCMKDVGGEYLKEIKLFSTSWGFTEKTYILIYGAALKEAEADRIQDKILDTLKEKYEIRIIKGYSRKPGPWKPEVYKVMGSCRSLDISKQANMGFRDDKANDGRGGLFDEGRSLVDLPTGEQKFSGIPFKIIDAAKNNGLACIVLKGEYKPCFPEEVKGIEVNQKVKNIYVMHTAAYGNTDKVVYKYRLNYSDGTSALIDVTGRKEINDWFYSEEFILTNAKIGWLGKVQTENGEIKAGIYCAKLPNPHPEKEIRTLDIISANGKAVPAIFAVTVAEN